jgi:hypothetical protein
LTIVSGLNFVDPIARDGTNTERRRHKIPSASALKRSNLLGHGKLPFRMTLSIPIRSQLEGNRMTVLTRRVTIRWTTLMSRKRRGNLIRRGRLIRRRGRRNIRRSIENSRMPRIIKGKGDNKEVDGMSEEEGGESGDEKDDGVEGETSAIMGPEGGSIGTEGGVSGKSRKDISSTG